MLSIIVAVSKNNVIGCNKSLVWRLPNDLKRFKSLTLNHKIIVGRKTFHTLPFVLPKREHIVLTRNTNFLFLHKLVVIEHNIDTLVKKYQHTEEEVFVIGGGEIYKQFLPYVSKIYLTTVLKSFAGDTTFVFDKSEFQKTYESDIIFNEELNLDYVYSNYTRIKQQ